MQILGSSSPSPFPSFHFSDLLWSEHCCPLPVTQLASYFLLVKFTLPKVTLAASSMA